MSALDNPFAQVTLGSHIFRRILAAGSRTVTISVTDDIGHVSNTATALIDIAATARIIGDVINGDPLIIGNISHGEVDIFAGGQALVHQIIIGNAFTGNGLLQLNPGSVAGLGADTAITVGNAGIGQLSVSGTASAPSEVDALKAHVRAAQAALAGARARVRARALDVEFTTVRAPMSGRISDRRVDPGNLVAAGDGASATLLTTINALDPIYFTFEGSEALFLKAKREGADRGAPVAIRLQDETDYRWRGTLDFTDNGLDPRSGTMRARAVLRNPDMFLTPGMFGNMRLASGGTVNALLVPDTAVQTDQARKILLVVSKDRTVAAKPVTLGPVVDGLRVISSGISADDRIIIQGTQMAVPGAKVRPIAGRIVPGPDEAQRSAPSMPPAEATLAR